MARHRYFGTIKARATRHLDARSPVKTQRSDLGQEVQPGTTDPAVIGSGQYRYGVVEGWGELPPGMSFYEATAVCVDSKDNVYVFNRGAHPVIVFDRDGNFLRSWGEDIGFTRAHGASIGPH
jgi:hypothetical protein